MYMWWHDILSSKLERIHHCIINSSWRFDLYSLGFASPTYYLHNCRTDTRFREAIPIFGSESTSLASLPKSRFRQLIELKRRASHISLRICTYVSTVIISCHSWTASVDCIVS